LGKREPELGGREGGREGGGYDFGDGGGGVEVFSLFEGFFEEDLFEVAVFEGCLEVNRCISRGIPSSCSFPTKSKCIPMRVYFNQYSSQTNPQHKEHKSSNWIPYAAEEQLRERDREKERRTKGMGSHARSPVLRMRTLFPHPSCLL